MKFEAKPVLVLVVALAVAAAAVFYAMDHSRITDGGPEPRAGDGREPAAVPPPMPPPKDDRAPAGPAEGAPEPGAGPAGERVTGAAPASRDRPSAPPRAVRSRSPYEIDWANEFDARAVLESALEGDRDDTIAVAELASQCRAVADDESQVRASLGQAARNAELGQPLPGLFIEGTAETLEFEDFAEYEERIWTRFEQCRVARGMFDRNLRERLVRLAQSGNATARYLYAMWLPDPGSGGADRMIEWITYQSLAMEFTWQNIRAGEPLGLLAYGRSLEQVGNVYFTPVHKRYGPAFILAARKCGLDNPVVNRKLANMTGQWQQRDMTHALDSAQDLSDAIVRLVCP